ncbi:hypothetical protein [Cellulophaga lytica]|uniref:Uncharacterized protein n=1 Tax=Cellulophaga lytica (strain ATCC 23178 / DSM 7489 / JCM 8516 / NBRC 14961 / NCIMB 1423 / VKM B-1433 / Cy l20) TaxID=867900 RepID=F0RIN1_CELLC|nr:hypothetical protein [Cellulophaga lytica]ADY30375.1 hypothetical protein Celly_2558 [Cellulophaga lytica DSM 7489]AIM61362.1 hypothetical protein IX49_12850 [Cellulophaga lytica]MDO6854926.1 hypothetical protein [Cellulophaga lytica]WQG78692.1 hypothetical protein SR888_07090 [Cellulophaga lytica]
MKSLPKNSGFKMPESYLDNFSEKLNNTIAQEQSAIPKKEGFTVPDNYFDSIHQNIQTKLNQKTEPKVIKLSSFKKRLYATSSIAAVVAILIAAVVFNNSSTPISFQDIAASDIESYFDENDIDFPTYDLAQIISIDDINVSDVTESEINEDEIMNYLESNNGIDIQGIYLDEDEK